MRCWRSGDKSRCIQQNLTFFLNKPWPLVLYLIVMNEVCHIPNEDIPQATTTAVTAVMKHFRMIWPTLIEVVQNFISLNFIIVLASRYKDRGCLFFFFFFGVPVCVFLLGMSKSWHPEGTCGLSQRAKINKTSALSSQILNLMRSSRGMCGRNMSKRIVWGSLCGIGINDKVT